MRLSTNQKSTPSSQGGIERCEEIRKTYLTACLRLVMVAVPLYPIIQLTLLTSIQLRYISLHSADFPAYNDSMVPARSAFCGPALEYLTSYFQADLDGQVIPVRLPVTGPAIKVA